MKIYALFHSNKLLGVYSSPELAKQKIKSEAIYLYDDAPAVRWDDFSCYDIRPIEVDGKKERYWCIVYIKSRKQWSIYECFDDYMVKTQKETVNRVDDRGYILYQTWLRHHSQGEALKIGKQRIRKIHKEYFPNLSDEEFIVHITSNGVYSEDEIVNNLPKQSTRGLNERYNNVSSRR